MKINKNECIENFIISKRNTLNKKENEVINKSFKINQIIGCSVFLIVIICFLLYFLFNVSGKVMFITIIIYASLMLFMLFGSMIITSFIITNMRKKFLKYNIKYE